MSHPARTGTELPDAAFGRAVKMVMFSRGTTQRRLARHLGIREAGLSMKLHGKRPWSLAEMIEVADWLDVDLRDLLGVMWNNPTPARRNPDEQAGTVRSTRRKVDAKGLAPVIPLRPGYAIAV